MTRNLSFPALILRNRLSGEANRDVWLLSAEAGLLRAAVFGGPKSRLRSFTSPYHSGQIWLYHEPVKDTYKVCDFDVKSWRPGLRESYERAMAAGTVAEAILESQGGGENWGKSLSLAEAALDALSEADSSVCTRITLWFLWQWVNFLGIEPEIDHCQLCGKPAVSPDVFYFSHGEGMICQSCKASQAYMKLDCMLAEIGPGCRHWLGKVFLHTGPVAPGQLSRFTMDKKSESEAITLVTGILSEAFGKNFTRSL